MEYPKPIKQAVFSLCLELKKHYPEVFEQSYDNHGFPAKEGCRFQNRIEISIYIELIKAGVKFEELLPDLTHE